MSVLLWSARSRTTSLRSMDLFVRMIARALRTTSTGCLVAQRIFPQWFSNGVTVQTDGVPASRRALIILHACSDCANEDAATFLTSA